ncbi:MAG: hypothetical protein ACRDDY_13935 [Clostridium sp.]|uniref:hypothetical protein n=1 Tax=Clostridium sp. TaxID=1506 RepID=UPI003EE6634A
MHPTLRELVFVEIRDMVVPEQRSMIMNFDQSMIDALTEEYEEQGKVNRDMISRTLNAGLDVSDTSYTPRIGRNGDAVDLRRMRWHALVEFEECTVNMPGISFFVSGFTGEIYDDDLVNIDDRLDMYINQITEYRTTMRRDKRGDEYVHYDVSKIILVQRKDHSSRDRHHTSRVEDILIFTDMEHSNTLETARKRGEIIVTGSAFMKEGKAADMRELNRSTFLFNLLDSDTATEADSRTYAESLRNPDIFGESRYQSASYSVHTNRYKLAGGLISFLGNRNPDVTQNGICQYRDWVDMMDVRNPIIEDLQDITVIMPIAGNDISYISREFYGKSSKMRSLAIACQEIPSMMNDYKLAQLSFTIDNDQLIDGKPEMSIDDFAAVSNIDTSDIMAQACLRRILGEVYDRISDRNRRYVYIRVSAAIGGQIEIEMEYENNAPEEFRYPASMTGIFGTTTSYEAENTYDNAKQYHHLSKEFVDKQVFHKGDDEKYGERKYNRWNEE